METISTAATARISAQAAAQTRWHHDDGAVARPGQFGHRLAVRAVRRLPSLPGMLLPAIGALARSHDADFSVNRLSARFSVAAPTLKQVEDYNRLVEGPGGYVPLTYFHLLAQRAQLGLMLDGRYPYAVAGMVELGNDMVMHQAMRWQEAIHIDVSAYPQVYAQAGDHQARSVVFAVELRQGHGVIARCYSSYLVSRGTTPPAARVAASGPAPEEAPKERWHLEEDIGRRYARVCGVYGVDPLFSRLARPFGFSHTAAPGTSQGTSQGMYAVGRAMAAIELQSGRRARAVTARFRQAIALPSTVNFWWHQAEHNKGQYALDTAQHCVLLSGTYELA